MIRGIDSGLSWPYLELLYWGSERVSSTIAWWQGLVTALAQSTMLKISAPCLKMGACQVSFWGYERRLSHCSCSPSRFENPCVSAHTLPAPFSHFSAGSSAIHVIPDFCSLFQDAHNCIPELDSETAMFSVYDGHGGNCNHCVLSRVLQRGSSRLPSGCRGKH